jgi:hypothetical protein
MLGNLRKVNLKDAAYWIAQSWEKIQLQVLARSWRKLLWKTKIYKKWHKEISIICYVCYNKFQAVRK